MANEFVIDGVSCWLPSIYNDIVMGYAMQGESFTFHGLQTQFDNRESRTDSRGICQTQKCLFDIQVINVSC
jgi:hypothetical protein